MERNWKTQSRRDFGTSLCLTNRIPSRTVGLFMSVVTRIHFAMHCAMCGSFAPRTYRSFWHLANKPTRSGNQEGFI